MGYVEYFVNLVAPISADTIDQCHTRRADTSSFPVAVLGEKGTSHAEPVGGEKFSGADTADSLEDCKASPALAFASLIIGHLVNTARKDASPTNLDLAGRAQRA